MYFDSYEEAHRAAIKQSKGNLTDCKLYIKVINNPIGRAVEVPVKYKVGFTPDNADDAYIYNGEVKQAAKENA